MVKYVSLFSYHVKSLDRIIQNILVFSLCYQKLLIGRVLVAGYHNFPFSLFRFALFISVCLIFVYFLEVILCILSQANKDAARYPVAARVAELLIKGLVSSKFLSYPFKT